MSINHHFTDGILVVEISDALIGQICTDIEKFIADLIKLNNYSSKKIALDISKKNFLNSMGLSDLIRTKDRLYDLDIELILINPTKRVRTLLKMIGVNDFFNTIDSESDLKKTERLI